MVANCTEFAYRLKNRFLIGKRCANLGMHVSGTKNFSAYFASAVPIGVAEISSFVKLAVFMDVYINVYVLRVHL
jgi:hypothetical protein